MAFKGMLTELLLRNRARRAQRRQPINGTQQSMYSMEAIRALTAKLAPFPPVIKQDGACHYYQMTEGEAIGKNLYYNPEVCVDHWAAKAGTLFPGHQHSELEWIVLIEGEMTVSYTDGKTAHALAGDCVFIPSCTYHSKEFHQASEYITITIPAAAEFPGARECQAQRMP